MGGRRRRGRTAATRGPVEVVVLGADGSAPPVPDFAALVRRYRAVKGQIVAGLEQHPGHDAAARALGTLKEQIGRAIARRRQRARVTLGSLPTPAPA